MKLTIEEIGYVEQIRARLGLGYDDVSLDEEIENMKPMERVRLLAGWVLGSESWADTFKGYFESQGLYLTTNPGADGVLL
jgi:hypothetical protein